MAKVIWKHCGKDHPIYKGGLQVFVPVSRPSTKTSSNDKAKSNKKRKPT